MTDDGFRDRRLIERRRQVLIVDAADEAPGAPLASKPRRSRRDRRAHERRTTDIPVTSDRRGGYDHRAVDRRGDADRRRGGDRRRETPAAFSREEAGNICQQARTPGKEVHCPRCRGRLLLRPPIAGAAESVWQVRCLTCHRCVMIKNL